MRSTGDEVVSSVEDLAGVVRCGGRLAFFFEETGDFVAMTSVAEGVVGSGVVDGGDERDHVVDEDL